MKLKIDKQEPNPHVEILDNENNKIFIPLFANGTRIEISNYTLARLTGASSDEAFEEFGEIKDLSGAMLELIENISVIEGIQGIRVIDDRISLTKAEEANWFVIIKEIQKLMKNSEKSS